MLNSTKYLTLTSSFILLGGLAACSVDAQNADTTAPATVAPAATNPENASSESASMESATMQPAADISALEAGTYMSENTHAYITFQYLHQGYARPTLRWNTFDAVAVVDPENPENSTLSVTIDAASIDSGVEKFDQHLVSGDFFDVANHPTITFNSTALDQVVTGRGTLTGELTMKGITKPLTLDVVANKTGMSRSKLPMFGISATTRLLRSDWDLGKYAPVVGDEVDISIEVEFVKAP